MFFPCPRALPAKPESLIKPLKQLLLMNTITITTPQNTEIEYELGSLGDRIVGAIIDWLIIIAYVIVIMATFVFGRLQNFSGTSQILLVVFALPP